MDEDKKTEVQRARDWLTTEVEIRVSRMVLVAFGVAALVLLGIAID